MPTPWSQKGFHGFPKTGIRSLLKEQRAHRKRVKPHHFPLSEGGWRGYREEKERKKQGRRGAEKQNSACTYLLEPQGGVGEKEESPELRGE